MTHTKPWFLIEGDYVMAMGKTKVAKKKMMRGGVAQKKMRGGGMAKMAKKKMMRGGVAKKK